MSSRWARNAIAIILVAIGVMALIQNQSGGVKTKAYAHTIRLDDSMRELCIVSNNLSLEVNFVHGGESSSSIQVEGRAKQNVIDNIEKAKVENGTLNLQFKDKWRWDLLNFGSWNDQQVITVSLSDEDLQSLESLKVISDSGSVRVYDAAALASTVETDSGSIRLGELRGDSLTVKSDSGSIKLDRYAGNSLSVKSSSGSIHAGTVQAKLKASSNSGSITVDHLAGDSEVKSNSGSIRIVKTDDTGADVSSDSGSVRMTVPDSYSGSYDLKSDSGSVHYPDSAGTSGERIKVRTDSGSIRVVRD